MAWDVWKQKNSRVDYARGEPPPAESHEWAGIPQSAADMMAKTRAKTVAGSNVDVKKDDGQKPLLWVIGGFVLGLITGSWGRRD